MNKTRLKKHNKYWRLLIACAIVLALITAALFMLQRQQEYLLLMNRNSGQALLCLPVVESGEFAVSFLHSVNKSPVTEYYRIEERQIYLEAMRYYTFGAGMPDGPEEGQTLLYTEDGAMLIEGFHRPLQELCYVIGSGSRHILHWQGNEMPLTSLAEPGQPLLFSVVTLSRWQALKIIL